MNKIRQRGKFYVYIVECADGTYYTGYTSNVKRRLREHNNGARGAKYTRYKRPVKLVWSKEYKQFQPALKAELAIKRLTRLQKETLINGRRLDKIIAEEKIKRKMINNEYNNAVGHLIDAR